MLGCVVTALALAMLACIDTTSLIDRSSRGEDAESETGQITDEEPKEGEVWQAEVDEIRRLTRGQNIPNHLINPEQPATEEVFDPNLLLTPLDHLSLQPGYVLDFVYRYDGMGGRPIIYAREESAAPYESYEAYHLALSDPSTEEDPPLSDYLRFIEADGTPESYFQWVLLRMMGGQFYLYWHSGYDDDEIIASQAQLEDLVGRMASTETGQPLSLDQKRQALKIDPAPVVEVQGDTATVRIVWFTKWGGFYETTYTISTSTPHQIMNEETNQLVEYECGIMF